LGLETDEDDTEPGLETYIVPPEPVLAIAEGSLPVKIYLHLIAVGF
jgi:hypothetical protein